MIYELFIIGGFWFWGLLFTSFCLLTWLTEAHKGFGATLVVLVTLFLLQVFGNVNVLKFMKENPGTTVVYCLVYLIMGAIWAFWKFYFFVRKKKEKYLTQKNKFINAGNTQEAWLVYVNADYNLKDLANFDINKPRILLWMMYWVPSAIWTIINDPVRRMCENIYRILSTAFKNMYMKVMKEAITDIEASKNIKKK